jgi:hypothetical protein
LAVYRAAETGTGGCEGWVEALGEVAHKVTPTLSGFSFSSVQDAMNLGRVP